MPRIVDGDNVLGSWPGRSRSDEDKRALVREVDRLVGSERRRVVVAFDGSPPAGLDFGPDVLFSGRGRSADAEILAFLRAEADPRGWVLVTGDRSLADRARWLGATIEPPVTFRERLIRPQRDEKPAPPGDVSYWLDVFGSDED